MSEQRTLLVIDDSEDEICLMERILSRVSPDIRVESALGGEEGLARLQTCSALPILTLLDLKMAGISGIETLRRIRSDDRLKNIPVAVLTNSTLAADREEALEAGASAFLHKAFDIDQFSSDITSLLQELSKD